MNLHYGRIVEIFHEDGMLAGKIRVRGAIQKVSLNLLVEPQIGDRVLICDGIAISKIEDQETAEIHHVSGNPG
jgi:hydrogenase maturation factor